jgi:hypothetical protein
MFVANNFANNVANGTRGQVVSFKESTPIVQLSGSGRLVKVEPHAWVLEEDGKKQAEVSQLPIRLAWAITIHKSQGMSLDSAEIDLSRSFTPGMGYVALSRVRSLAGLYLAGINAMAMQLHPAIHEFDVELRKLSRALAEKTDDFREETEGIEGVKKNSAKDGQLLKILKQWRQQEATKRSLPAYMIASNKTLESLSEVKPTSLASLQGVSGVGPKFLEKYGKEMVEMICNQTGVVKVEQDDPLKEFLAQRNIALSEEDLKKLRMLL